MEPVPALLQGIGRIGIVDPAPRIRPLLGQPVLQPLNMFELLVGELACQALNGGIIR